jgi:antitoxin component YwqK of YwqJK toxin-antitoxin module
MQILKKGAGLLIFSLFVGCSPTQSPKKSVIERVLAGDYSAYNELPRYSCEVLHEKNERIHTSNDSLFTGICFTNYPNTQLVMQEKQYYKGVLHGFVSVLDKQGDTLTTNFYQFGKLIPNASQHFQCDCKELSEQKKVQYLNGLPYSGTCFSFYKDANQKYMEKHYKNGVLDGFLIVYDRAGEILSSTKYSAGEVVH